MRAGLIDVVQKRPTRKGMLLMIKAYVAVCAFLLSLSPIIAIADTNGDAANKAEVVRDCESVMAAGPNANFDEFCSRYAPKRLVPGGIPVALPGGTPIRVHLSAKLSSKSAVVGDDFGITVIDEVRVGDRLVISQVPKLL